MDKLGKIAFMQGISDWWRFKSRVPYVWKLTEEGKIWKRGFDYAANWHRG